MPDKEPEYMTGSELIAEATKVRAELTSMWDGLTDEQMTCRPGVQDDWSVKDLIAHLTWWESHMVEWVALATSGGTVVRDETIDEANTRIFNETKDTPLDVILAEWDASFPKFIALVKTLSDEQINDATVAHIEGKRCLHFLGGDTFGHYRSHWGDLETYVNSLK